MTYIAKFLLTVMIMLTAMAAQSEPLKVRVWSGWAPGGPIDRQVRLLQKYLQQDPNTQVIVEYKTGAAGALALNHFVNLVPSDYVELLIDAPGMLITGLITKTHKVDLVNDIQILLPIGHTPMLLLTPVSLGITSIDDLRKTKKFPIIYASSGVGSASHFTTAYLDNYIKKEFVHVPYKGSAAVYPDLLAGRVDLFSVLFNDGVEYTSTGKLNAIGITGSSRHPRLPNVRTLEEQGIKNFPINPWFAVFTHTKNNSEKTKQVHHALKKILSDPEIQKSYLDTGVFVTKSGLDNPLTWWQGQIDIYTKLSKEPKFSDLANK